MQGTVLNGLFHTADFYTTFCSLAGVDSFDYRAAAAGLPPVDGHDMWPYLSGANETSPRTQIYGDKAMVIDGEWKYLNDHETDACWSGPTFPNASTQNFTCPLALNCGQTGCLFNIYTDPTEQHDVSDSNPAKAKEMAALLSELKQGYFNPERGRADPAACDRAMKGNGGYWGPWVL